MQTIIGVRFRPVGKIYYFEPDEQSYEFGDGVIVETARGVEFGRIAVPPKEVEDKNVPSPSSGSSTRPTGGTMPSWSATGPDGRRP